LLIDELDAPRHWDRATVIHARSMEIFEALGLAERFLEAGLKVRAARFRSDGELLGELDLELTGRRYGFDLGLSEETTERILTEHLDSVGGTVTRSTGLVGFVNGVDGITATLERDGVRSEVEAEWLIGCDGLHSVVRDQSGIEFPGSDIQAPWAVFDATIRRWDQDFDVVAAFLDTPPVILTPLPGRRWRVYMRPTSDETDLVSEASQVLHRYVPHGEFTTVENPARFYCHSRVARTYRSGRALLAGDAAHVCSPAEGHGMNTGIQDAFNLGWKLALVCRGAAGESLLDTYEIERRPVADRVATSGADVEAGQALTEAADRAERDATVRHIYGHPESAHHEAAAAAELDRSYADSTIVSGTSASGVVAGRLLPDNAPVEHPATGSTYLHRLAHRPGHTLMVLGGPDADPGAVAELTEALQRLSDDSTIVEAAFGFTTGPGGPTVGQTDEGVAARLGIDRVTLLAVRPDGYVGLRHDAPDPGAVSRYLEALTGWPGAGLIGRGSDTFASTSPEQEARWQISPSPKP
jgi:2-polyprenyl-6-methoxyphenol hydroxylase-like FAD-dependent oxidoreductase